MGQDLRYALVQLLGALLVGYGAYREYTSAGLTWLAGALALASVYLAASGSMALLRHLRAR